MSNACKHGATSPSRVQCNESSFEVSYVFREQRRFKPRLTFVSVETFRKSRLLYVVADAR